METLALIGLAIAGLSYSSNEKMDNNGLEETQEILNESYESGNREQVEKIKKEKAIISKENKKIINTLKKPDSFDKQFNSLSYDRVGIPGASNQSHTTATGIDAGLKRALELKGEYSDATGYDMSYGVVSQENFTHNNMVPFTNRRDISMNLDRDARKLENHTGGDIFWKKKKEVPTLFEPMKDLTHVFGMPNYTNKIVGRYNASTYKRNEELPGSRQRVGPGLNGQEQDGMYNRMRILPKNVDNLRAANDQKVTYEGRMVESGLKGRKRESNINLTAFKKPDFREQEFNDLVKNSSAVKQRTIHGKYQEPNTNRTQSLSYAGVAAMKTVGDGNNKDRTHFTESNKTTHNFGVSNATNENAGYYAQNNDIARRTIKETTLANYEGNAANENAGYYAQNNDIARKTVKETTLSGYGGNATRENGTYAQNNDVARKTIKETTSFEYEGNPNTEQGTYLRNRDIARRTIGETTSFEYEGNPNTKGRTYLKNRDIARRTIGETTSFEYEGNANFINGTYLNNGQEAKITIRQTTADNDYLGGAELNNGNYQKITGDRAKTTIRETTSVGYQGITGNGNVNSSYINNGDDARTTIKETTLVTNYKGTANSYNKNSSSQDAARNMCIDERREILTYSRPSNGGADISGPDKSTYGRYENTKQAQEFGRMSNAHKPYNLASGTVDINYTRVGRQLESRNTYNPYVKESLNKNPYVNNIVYGVSK
jgi:hypothetical protein